MTVTRPVVRPALIIALLVLSACAPPTTVRQIDTLETIDDQSRVVLMTPDIKYYLLTAGGVPQPHAEWTEAARNNFNNSVRSFAEARDIEIVDADETEGQGEIESIYTNLHSAVGQSVLQHHFGAVKLPAKDGAFDWSLRPGVVYMRDKYDAPYALFVHYRDYQASGGRIAFALLAAAAGVAVPTGAETGFASLIDLETGDIVWFNVVNIGSGELRNPDGARTVVDQLLTDLPGR